MAHPEEVSFILNGEQHRLTRGQVERAMRGQEPESIRSLGVVVAGVRYPVKQVFSAATNLDRLDFTSEVARRHLGRLGFNLIRTSR